MTSPGILFVTPWLFGGGIEHNLEVKVPCLVKRGHRVAVASWQVAETLSGRPNPVLAALARHGVRVIRLRRRSPLGLPRLAASVAFRALTGRYRVVVGHELTGNLVVLMAKALTGGRLRAIGELHNDPATYLETGAAPRLLALASRLYPHADRLIAVSEQLRREHAAFFGLPPARITTIYNPFDLEAIRGAGARPHATLDGGAPFVVGCGRLAPIKGFPDLIAAFARVRAWHPGVRLVILGDGPDRESLARLAAAHGIGDAVDLPGFVAEPTRHFARARCFVLSSLSEGLPRVVLEAMAAGTPVIASRCGGVEEVVEDGKTGLLYDPGDIAALARALGTILTDPGLATDLVRTAWRRVEDFAEDRVLPRLEQAYLT